MLKPEQRIVGLFDSYEVKTHVIILVQMHCFAYILLGVKIFLVRSVKLDSVLLTAWETVYCLFKSL